MFERYTEPARRALFYARYECSHVGSISIEPEHLLLGVLREPGDLVDLIPMTIVYEVRQQLLEEATRRPPNSTSIEIPFAAETKRALEAAGRAADALRHGHIGTEHLLLALAETADTARVLSAHGVIAGTLRKQIADRPAPTGSPPPPPSPASSRNPHARRNDTLLQLDAAVTLLRSIGTEHAGVPGAEGLVNQICRDLDSLKAVIAGA